MDPTVKTYSLAGAALLVGIMVLSLTNRVTGVEALDAIVKIAGLFFLGKAALGGATAVANALAARVNKSDD